METLHLDQKHEINNSFEIKPLLLRRKLKLNWYLQVGYNTASAQ